MGLDLKAAENIAHVLTEALPYIQKFSGWNLVIKYGGNAMIDEKLKASFASDVALMKAVGMNPIIVHGGGPQIGEALAKMGKKSEFLEGMRKTDRETMDVVEDVLLNDINKEIVNLINDYGGSAFSVVGKNKNFILAEKLKVSKEQIDIGFVGKVKTINKDILQQTINENRIPVIAPIGIDENGNSYNINADLVAGKISEIIIAEKLILLTNIAGVYDENRNLLSQIKTQDVKSLVDRGVITSGMLPKIDCALNAVNSGVKMAHIIDGRIKNAVLLELFTDQGIGTLIN
tara:strand:+ start:7933 stop:8799 length:867 start_codon:yes stop_codon:yes gene_type:complete